MPRMMDKRVWLCSGLLLLNQCLTLSSSLIAEETAVEDSARNTVDLTLRYVNEAIISFGDVIQRNQMRIADYDRRRQPKPATRDEMIQFSNESLSELTDEELLIQYGKEMSEQRGFRLVDHERIAQMVMERAKASGRGLSLRVQAEERKFIERQQIIDVVMGYFESRAPHIPPELVEREYQARQAEFSRPARAQVLQCLLRASSPQERQEIKQIQLAIFRRAQDSADQRIRQICEQHLDSYTVANAEEQQQILQRALADIAAQAERTDLDAITSDFVKQAQTVQQRAANLRDKIATKQTAEKIRAALMGKGSGPFKLQTQLFSQGPNAIDGGDMGWIEAGTFQPEVENFIFETAPVGDVSSVLAVDDTVYLFFVVERHAAQVRSFAEVVGEIESGLRRTQVAAVRQTAVRMLREKASVRDLTNLETLLGR
jgi:parvulin-like peptidyl-prolyl isomerase